MYSKTNGENVHVLKNENEHTNKHVDIHKLGKLSEAVYCQIHDGLNAVKLCLFISRGVVNIGPESSDTSAFTATDFKYTSVST